MPSFIPRNSPTLGLKMTSFADIKKTPYCTVVKEKDKDWRGGKNRERIYWFRLLGVVTRSLEGCNPCPHVTHGSGMRRSPCNLHGMQSLSPNRHIWGCHATPRHATPCYATPRHALRNLLPPNNEQSHPLLTSHSGINTFVFAGFEVPVTLAINITLEAT